MSSAAIPAAASALLAALLDEGATLVEVVRTASSVHYETGRVDVPVLSVCGPGSVRLPNAVVAPVLPSGPLVVREGRLESGARTWRVARWWRPPRPRGLPCPARLGRPGGLPHLVGVEVPAVVRPLDLVGRGPGLTPRGDDVVCGALVAASATADPRQAGWRAATRIALRDRGTTAVSRALLEHALDGWSTAELADFVAAVCEPGVADLADASARLLAVGGTSGAALAAGALHVLSTDPGRSAA